MIKQVEICQANMKYIRKTLLHLSLEKVAKWLEISVSTVRRAELGFNVKEATIKKILNFYKDYGNALVEARKQKEAKKEQCHSMDWLCHA